MLPWHRYTVATAANISPIAANNKRLESGIGRKGGKDANVLMRRPYRHFWKE